MLALSFLSFTIAISFAFALSLASGKVVLMVGAMTLLVEVTVAVEAATSVERLAIHNVWLLEASITDLVSSCNRSGHDDMALCGKGQERRRGGFRGVCGWRVGSGSGDETGRQMPTRKGELVLTAAASIPI
jgi:hypothetical protein